MASLNIKLLTREAFQAKTIVFYYYNVMHTETQLAVREGRNPSLGDNGGSSSWKLAKNEKQDGTVTQAPVRNNFLTSS